ncbi:MAG: hypothetical protein K6G00_10360 [Treponema sp.]|nr:hypothetical protein [Treponema sp.]
MKKTLLFIVFTIIFHFSHSFAQAVVSVDESVPELLGGIWENDSRYVVFDTSSITLRTFYQWYDDRAAENPEQSQSVPRDRNDAETRSPERIELHFTPLTDELYTESFNKAVVQADGDLLTAETLNSGAWDMEIKYSGHKLGGEDTYHVPIAVIGNKLYLNFALRSEDSDSVPKSALLKDITIQSENILDGYWKDTGNANGILVSPPVTSKELLSYYITKDAVYHIRYWSTDMMYDENAEAVFTDGDTTYKVPKHILSSGKVYTCTVGRRNNIRNIDKSSSLPDTYTLNTVLVHKKNIDENGEESSYTVRTATICAFGEPYLTLTDGSKSLIDIVKEHNLRKKPMPEPLFPPHGVLDFDWSIIEDPPASYDRRMLDLGK